jgi:hypothetical protein
MRAFARGPFFSAPYVSPWCYFAFTALAAWRLGGFNSFRPAADKDMKTHAAARTGWSSLSRFSAAKSQFNLSSAA